MALGQMSSVKMKQTNNVTRRRSTKETALSKFEESWGINGTNTVNATYYSVLRIIEL